MENQNHEIFVRMWDFVWRTATWLKRNRFPEVELDELVNMGFVLGAELWDSDKSDNKERYVVVRLRHEITRKYLNDYTNNYRRQDTTISTPFAEQLKWYGDPYKESTHESELMSGLTSHQYHYTRLAAQGLHRTYIARAFDVHVSGVNITIKKARQKMVEKFKEATGYTEEELMKMPTPRRGMNNKQSEGRLAASRRFRARRKRQSR